MQTFLPQRKGSVIQEVKVISEANSIMCPTGSWSYRPEPRASHLSLKGLSGPLLSGLTG